jgi:uncharacterized protein YjdB
MPRRIAPSLSLCAALLAPPLLAQTIAEVQVAPPEVTLKVGERSGLLATAFDRLGNVIPTVRFIWSSNNIQVARVDNNGTVIGVAPGVAIVEARVGSRRGVAAVQVAGGTPAQPASPGAAAAAAPAAPADAPSGQPPGSGPAAALRIEPPTVYLLPSENARVTVRALREDGGPAAPVAVTWASLVPAIASVSAGGVVVALAPGQGTIQVTGPAGLTATAPVMVQQTDIAIQEQGPLLLSPGEPDTLHVIVPAQNGREVSPLGLVWTSSDTNIVKIGLTGVMTPVGPGTAAVTAAGLLQSRTIEVAVHRPVEILVARPRTQDEVRLPLSGVARFEVEALATDQTPVPEAPIRWAVADPGVAGFDPATGMLTGRAIGRTQLTARAPGRGLAVTWTVEVAAGDVRIVPARVGLAPGRRLALRAEFLGDGGTVLGPAQPAWSSEDAGVATVGADGTVTAVGWGRTRIVAAAPGGKTAAAEVFVLGEIVLARTAGGPLELFATQRADLADLRKIQVDTLGATDAAFSADGSRVAVVSSRDGNPEIYVMNPDGTDAVRLTTHPAADGAPAFSPDGRTVVFHSDREGNRRQIFAVDADGGNLRQLTRDSTNSQPTVSPDGQTVAYVTTRQRNYDIWLMTRDGSDQRPFTRSPQWHERHPQFLRDGSLAYLVERREGDRTITQVMRAEVGTGTVTSLSGIDLVISDFAVSPAGDLLALVVPAPGEERRRTPVYRVVIVPVGGGTGTPVYLPARDGEQMLAPTFVP